VSTLTEQEQNLEILTFLRDHMSESLSKGALPADFDQKLEFFEESLDAEQILRYIISLKSALI
jgi:hypothetical protein